MIADWVEVYKHVSQLGFSVNLHWMPYLETTEQFHTFEANLIFAEKYICR